MVRVSQNIKRILTQWLTDWTPPLTKDQLLVLNTRKKDTSELLGEDEVVWLNCRNRSFIAEHFWYLEKGHWVLAGR